MSSVLKWKLVEKYEGNLSTETKFILRKLYSEPIRNEFLEQDIIILEAIMVASNIPDVQQDMKRLIDALRKFGKIIVIETS